MTLSISRAVRKAHVWMTSETAACVIVDEIVGEIVREIEEAVFAETQISVDAERVVVTVAAGDKAAAVADAAPNTESAERPEAQTGSSEVDQVLLHSGTERSVCDLDLLPNTQLASWQEREHFAS